MRLKAMTGTSLGLLLVLSAWGSVQCQESKTPEPAKAAVPRRQDAKEPAEKAVGGLVEQIRRHPLKPLTVVGRGRLYVFDVESGEAMPFADESDRGFTACGSPTWSNDGRRILFDAFPRGAPGLAHVMVIDVVEGRPTVTDLGPGNCPTFSPAGDRIAFYFKSGAVPEEEGGVWLMQSDGSRRRLLGNNGRPKWTPDGREMMLISLSEPGEVTLMDVKPEKSGPLRIPGQSIYSCPSWAGPARIVAVIGSEGLGDTIALIDVSNPAQGKVEEVLWKNGDGLDMRLSDPVYSARARRCVFVGAGPDGMALYTVEPGKSKPPKQLEPGDYDSLIWDLAYSPDGRHVLFGSIRPNRDQRAPARAGSGSSDTPREP